MEEMCPEKGPECLWAGGGGRRPDGGGAGLGAGVSHAPWQDCREGQTLASLLLL